METSQWLCPHPQEGRRTHWVAWWQWKGKIICYGFHTQLYGTFCAAVLDNTPHRKYTIWGNNFWKNGVHLSSTVPETCKISAEPRHTEAVLVSCGLSFNLSPICIRTILKEKNFDYMFASCLCVYSMFYEFLFPLKNVPVDCLPAKLPIGESVCMHDALASHPSPRPWWPGETRQWNRRMNKYRK